MTGFVSARRHPGFVIRTAAACAAALLTAWVTLPTSFAATPVPQAVSAKLANDARIERLWSEPGLRLPVIIEFAMPALPAADLGNSEQADAALTSAIRLVQDAILKRLINGASGIPKTGIPAGLSLKRMNFSPLLALTATAADIENLTTDPRILRIHEDGLSKPSLDESIAQIGMPNAYSTGATGAGQYLAILDTGGRHSHEFLRNRVERAACFSTTNATLGVTSLCPGGVPVSMENGSADDCSGIAGCGHGTFVAGIAAGYNSNRQSGEPTGGVARDARLISVNIYSRVAPGRSCLAFLPGHAGSCLLSFDSDQILALEHIYSLRREMRIAAATLAVERGKSGTHCDRDARKPIIDRLRAAGIATIVGTGNGGYRDGVSFPACISSAIAVMATDSKNRLWPFSNRGTPTALTAPGVDVSGPSPEAGQSAYVRASGTSAAAAHVAGVWAALKTARPDASLSEIAAALSRGANLCSGMSCPMKPIAVGQALESLYSLPDLDSFDFFGNAIDIAQPQTVTGTNWDATYEMGEPVHAGVPTATASVWWRYTARASGLITVDTFGSSFDTVLGVYVGSAVDALITLASNNDGPGSLQSKVSFQVVAGTTYHIAVAGLYHNRLDSQGSINLTLRGGGPAMPVAAATPAARAARVGGTVTAFATMINTGNIAGDSCSIAVPAGRPLTFSYRARASNGVLGPVNTPVSITPFGGQQNFVLSFAPTAAMSANLALVFDCTNSAPAPSVVGLNTFLLTATTAQPADVVATAATPSRDGIMNVPLRGTGVAALAAVNIGVSAPLQARLSASAIGAPAATLPGSMFICRTNPATGQCLAAPTGPAVNVTPGANQTVTFTALFRSNGTAIPFDPARKRLFVNFYQGSTPVGSASVAIRTTTPAGGGEAVAVAR